MSQEVSQVWSRRPDGTKVAYYLKDVTARNLINAGIRFVLCVDAATTPKGVVWQSKTETITGTLEAADAIKGRIYLVPQSVNDIDDSHDEYVVVELGQEYSWEKIGSTRVMTYTGEDTDSIELHIDDVNMIISAGLKGYDEAHQGHMLVKDEELGLAWIAPVSDASLQAAVAAAENSKNQAGNYATQAGNSAIAADNAASTANRINQQTMAWVNKKFWWGSLEEYNNLESIDAGTFYFISLEE